LNWIPDNAHFEPYAETTARLANKHRLLEAARPLPSIAIQKIKESLAMEWTYNSNGIEGNTLTLSETHMVLSEGMTVGGKSLREHFEAYNHNKAISLLYAMADRNEKNNFSAADLLDLHATAIPLY